jgi:beta-glucanase (GH16 family)
LATVALTCTTLARTAAADGGSDAGPLGQEGRWRPLFSEEFAASTLDHTKWATCYWWQVDNAGCTNLGNNELQWYQRKNLEVAGGVLRIRAVEQTIPGYQGRSYRFTSGLISTGAEQHLERSKFDFTYGYAEIRARVPAGPGLLPAFWMLPSTQDSKPEIDVVEVLGQEPDILRLHYHYRDEGVDRVYGTGVKLRDDVSADWHVYGVDWRPDRITWYLDGMEQLTFDDSRLIPKEPMYLLVNLAVGGTWPGAPDQQTKFPADFLVDYVRVWQRVEASGS